MNVIFDRIDDWQERHPFLGVLVAIAVWFGVILPVGAWVFPYLLWIIGVLLDEYIGRVLFNFFGSI